eukprot:1334644-Amorphochlora_amoeboformis.AAC.3
MLGQSFDYDCGNRGVAAVGRAGDFVVAIGEICHGGESLVIHCGLAVAGEIAVLGGGCQGRQNKICVRS